MALAAGYAAIISAENTLATASVTATLWPSQFIELEGCDGDISVLITVPFLSAKSHPPTPLSIRRLVEDDIPIMAVRHR
jgi:hypothetical protein